MSATYVIDGYNLLHAMGVLSGRVGPGGLEKARLRLLGLLVGTFAAQASAVTVVFDASRAPRKASAETTYRGLHVHFALGAQEEADDVIERLLREASAPKSVHVVSDDRRVQQAARRRQATVLTCEEFLLWVERQRPQQRTNTETAEKQERLSPEEMQSWLAEFGDVESDPSLRQAFEKFDFEEE
jgi:predicted RNA-binding protein with PIN domain